MLAVRSLVDLLFGLVYRSLRSFSAHSRAKTCGINTQGRKKTRIRLANKLDLVNALDVNPCSLRDKAGAYLHVLYKSIFQMYRYNVP